MANNIGHGTGGDESSEGKARAHRVRALANEGKSDQEIAEELGMTVEEVQELKDVEL